MKTKQQGCPPRSDLKGTRRYHSPSQKFKLFSPPKKIPLSPLKDLPNNERYSHPKWKKRSRINTRASKKKVKKQVTRQTVARPLNQNRAGCWLHQGVTQRRILMRCGSIVPNMLRCLVNCGSDRLDNNYHCFHLDSILLSFFDGLQFV